MRTSLRCLIALSLSGSLAALCGCTRTAVPAGPEPVVDARPRISSRAGTAPQVVAKQLDPKKEKQPDTPKKPRPTGDGFSFPADEGGKLLAELLRPTEQMASTTDTASGPRRLRPPVGVDRPNPALPAIQTGLPQARLKPTAPPLRPRGLPEDAPLTSYQRELRGPQLQVLAGGGVVRVESVDVNQPVPLPILAQPVADRAPVDDPTTTASIVAALAAAPPPRNQPTPFVRLSLPDPFELAVTIRLRTPPKEDPEPFASSTRP